MHLIVSANILNHGMSPLLRILKNLLLVLPRRQLFNLFI